MAASIVGWDLISKSGERAVSFPSPSSQCHCLIPPAKVTPSVLDRHAATMRLAGTMFIGERLWNQVDWGKSESGIRWTRSSFEHIVPVSASTIYSCILHLDLLNVALRRYLAALTCEGPRLAGICGVQHSLCCRRAHQGPCRSGLQDCR